jgi:phosphate/sulfate permease
MVGAIVGITLLQGFSVVRWSVLGKITIGWAVTPFAAAIISFFGLFILQNVSSLK